MKYLLLICTLVIITSCVGMYEPYPEPVYSVGYYHPYVIHVQPRPIPPHVMRPNAPRAMEKREYYGKR